MRTFSRILLPLLLLSLPGLAVAAENPHLKRGIQLLHDMEDAKALVELQKALEVEAGGPREKAVIHVHIGIAEFNLMRADEAKQSFRAALKLDPMVVLPAMTSPKIHEVFDEVRREVAAAGVTPGPATTPTGEPPTGTTPTAQETGAPQRRGLSRYWPAFATLGLAAAAGLAGMTCGLLAKSSEESANDLKIPYAAAKDHHDAATTRALAANVMFGVAGAAAITSGVLFLVLRPRAERSTASVVPLPSGAAVQVQARW